jgi:excisionase family DNA binding protein
VTASLLLTVKEAAQALALSERTVWGLLDAEAIESVRIGRARRIPRQALDAYIDTLRNTA